MELTHLPPALIGDGVKKGDKITLGEEIWKVWNAIERNGIYIYSDMYLFEDETEDDSDYSTNSTGGNIAPREDYE